MPLQAEFLHDIVTVKLDGPGADIQRIADLTGGQATSKIWQYFPFTLTQGKVRIEVGRNAAFTKKSNARCATD
jgi:hypothetical protein